VPATKTLLYVAERKKSALGSLVIQDVHKGSRNINSCYILALLLFLQVLLEQVAGRVRRVFWPLVSACQTCRLLGVKRFVVLGLALAVDAIQYVSAVEWSRRTVPRSTV